MAFLFPVFFELGGVFDETFQLSGVSLDESLQTSSAHECGHLLYSYFFP